MKYRKYFACSVGQPDEGYDRENLDRIIHNKAFILHENTKMKGHYYEIESEDIVILKYRNQFIAYGEVIERKQTADKEWNLYATVSEWHFNDPNNVEKGVSTYGIQDSTYEGSGQMGTVKRINEGFGLKKLQEINPNIGLIAKILKENRIMKAMKVTQERVKLLEYKKQIILQGPPGTGKTYTAKDIAEMLLTGDFSEDKGVQKEKLTKCAERYRIIQFHPAYSYEDFVRGITAKPQASGVGIEYFVENKPLAKFAEDAAKDYEDYLERIKIPTKKEWISEKLDQYLDDAISTIAANGKKVLNNTGAFLVSTNKNNLIYNHDSFGGTGFPETVQVLATIMEQLQLEKPVSTMVLTHSHVGNFLVPFLEDFKKFVHENFDYLKRMEEGDVRNYVMIIDEINRANLPAVLGELIYGLEYRGEDIATMYEYKGRSEIKLPPNLYIIGTMNTADRSVGHIDYAIRRRFAFVPVLPSGAVIDEVITDATVRASAKELYKKVAAFFTAERLMGDFKKEDVQLGHSYFLAQKKEELELKLEYEIKPLLKEYLKDGILKSMRNDKDEDQTEIDINNLKIV